MFFDELKILKGIYACHVQVLLVSIIRFTPFPNTILHLGQSMNQQRNENSLYVI